MGPTTALERVLSCLCVFRTGSSLMPLPVVSDARGVLCGQAGQHCDFWGLSVFSTHLTGGLTQCVFCSLPEGGCSLRGSLKPLQCSNDARLGQPVVIGSQELHSHCQMTSLFNKLSPRLSRCAA